MRLRPRSLLAAVLPVCWRCSPSPAWAHEQQGQAAGFLTGLLHPVSGPRPRAGDGRGRAVGRAARRPGDLAAAGDVPAGDGVRRLPRACSACRCPGVEIGIAASAILLGAMVAAEARPPLCARRAAGRRSSPSSTATPTAPSCRPARAACSTASASWSPPAACTPSASPSASIHRWAAGRIALRGAGAAVAARRGVLPVAGVAVNAPLDRSAHGGLSSLRWLVAAGAARATRTWSRRGSGRSTTASRICS